MRQIHLKCPYCSKEGYVPFDKVRRFINHDQVKEPVSLPCAACAAMHANQPTQRLRKGGRFWNWFDRMTRCCIIAKVVVAMMPMTLALVVIGFMTDVTQRLGAYHADEVHLILMILFFCEDIFLLGLLTNIPYDYSYDVILNPAFEDLKENAWHVEEINQA
jgi:hypothetical protein